MIGERQKQWWWRCASQIASSSSCNGFSLLKTKKFARNARFFFSQFGPFLAFLSLSFFLLYKVDVYISRSRAFARYQNTEPPPVTIQRPISYNKTRPFRRILTNGTFDRNFEITWGDENARIIKNGELLTLSLDSISGSGFQSRNEYLFGQIDMQIKLVPENSAGTVTTYYLSSEAETREGDNHDEIDFEFLGNLSGEPYTLHTNVFSQGKGMREQQFFLWFDPTADFHTYSIVWNPQRIIFIVDDTPIREFKNAESIGVPFPKDQPMRIYSSIWNADEWATQGGRVKTDWTMAPFIASFRNFSADACIWSSGVNSCNSNSPRRKVWFTQKLNTADTRKLRWVQKYHMVYDYCKDTHRFPEGPAPECRFS